MIRIGILGTANIAERHMIPAILELKEQYALQGIASRKMETADKVAIQFDIQPYEGYDSLINSNNIDVIYIPLPNSLHAEWIEKALINNLHILVEKSLACNLADVDRLNRMASRKNLALVENFQFRFHKQLRVIQNLVSNGNIGELRCLRSSFGFPPFPDPENIRYKKELGGGSLLDAGAYPLKITQIFLGHDIEVSAANLWYHNKKDVDIWGGAYLRQKNGPLFAEVAFGFDNYYQCNLELWGSNGKITANRIFTSPPGEEPEIILETNNGKKNIVTESDNHFKNMLLHFYKLIVNNNGLNDEYEQNINQSRLLQELKEKANEK